MVYHRYIKRGGKIYGPYTYHSKKINGKVVSTYVGNGPKHNFRDHKLHESSPTKQPTKSKKHLKISLRKVSNPFRNVLSSVTSGVSKAASKAKNFPYKTFLKFSKDGHIKCMQD